MNKKASDIFIRAQDGTEIHGMAYDVGNPVAALCILHGHGGHSGRYVDFMDWLAGQGIASLAIDQRGHGQTKGRRGHFSSINNVLGDVEEALKWLRSSYLDVPLYLFGHSFGGLVTLEYVARKPPLELNGFIASAPWLRLASPLSGRQKRRLSLLDKIVPWFDLSGFVHKPAGDDNRDQWSHKSLSIRFLKESVKAGEELLSGKVRLPASVKGLIYHGDHDKQTDFDASKSFSEMYATQVTFQSLPGADHSFSSEEEARKVWTMARKWILDVSPEN